MNETQVRTGALHGTFRSVYYSNDQISWLCTKVARTNKSEKSDLQCVVKRVWHVVEHLSKQDSLKKNDHFKSTNIFLHKVHHLMVSPVHATSFTGNLLSITTFLCSPFNFTTYIYIFLSGVVYDSKITFVSTNPWHVLHAFTEIKLSQSKNFVLEPQFCAEISICPHNKASIEQFGMQPNDINVFFFLSFEQLDMPQYEIVIVRLRFCFFQ